MREQVHIACEELHGPEGMRITFDAMIPPSHPPSRIQPSALPHSRWTNRPPQMPSTRTLRNDLRNDHETHRTPCSGDIQVSIGFIFYFFGIGLLPDTLRHIFGPHQGQRPSPGSQWKQSQSMKPLLLHSTTNSRE
jgi:hypothetical protein